MAAKKYLKINSSGEVAQGTGVVTSAGAGNDGDLVALDSTGKLDPSVLPVGVGPDVKVLLASESLNAGSYVNIWNDAGTEKVRLADNSSGRDAHGFVNTAVSSGASATVYFEGPNNDLTGLTPGARYYLGTAGAATSTPLDPNLLANANKVHQFLGIAISATEINTDIDDKIVL